MCLNIITYIIIKFSSSIDLYQISLLYYVFSYTYLYDDTVFMYEATPSYISFLILV